MRKLLLIMLMFVIPYQFAWAGAAAYCSHESDATGTPHFGHHQHVHATCKADTKASQGKKLTDDRDCGSCNLNASLNYLTDATQFTAVLHSFEAALSPPIPKIPPPFAAPERPQWRRFA